MAKFQVTTTVIFSGEVEADSLEEAEAKGWEWEDELQYEAVDTIEVDELDDDEEEEHLHVARGAFGETQCVFCGEEFEDEN